MPMSVTPVPSSEMNRRFSNAARYSIPSSDTAVWLSEIDSNDCALRQWPERLIRKKRVVKHEFLEVAEDGQVECGHVFDPFGRQV